MSNDLLSKGLSLVRGWFEPPPEKVLERIRDELRECAALIGGEESARQRAAKHAKTYAELDENGKVVPTFKLYLYGIEIYSEKMANHDVCVQIVPLWN